MNVQQLTDILIREMAKTHPQHAQLVKIVRDFSQAEVILEPYFKRYRDGASKPRVEECTQAKEAMLDIAEKAGLTYGEMAYIAAELAMEAAIVIPKPELRELVGAYIFVLLARGLREYELEKPSKQAEAPKTAEPAAAN
jgi:hypothetical protein